MVFAAVSTAAAALGRSLSAAWIASFAVSGIPAVLGASAAHPIVRDIGDPLGIRIVVAQVLAMEPRADGGDWALVTDALLTNRIVWLAVALALCIVIVGVGFRRTTPAVPRTGKGGGGLTNLINTAGPIAASTRLTIFHLKYLWRSLTFRLGAPVLLVLLSEGVRRIAAPFYVPSLPTTASLLGALGGAYMWAMMVWIALLAIDLGERERDERMYSLARTLPLVPEIWWVSRAIALCITLLLIQSAALALLLALTSAHVTPAMLGGTLMSLLPALLVACATVALHAWLASRLGVYLLILAIAAAGAALSTTTLGPGLVQFARLPSLHLSDMLGIAEPSPRWSVYAVYWLLATALSWAVALRAERRAPSWPAAVLMVAWTGTGVLISVQTPPTYPNVDAWQAKYELAMRKHATPSGIERSQIELTADFNPSDRQVTITGAHRYRFAGPGEVAVLPFSFPMGARTKITLDVPYRIVESGEGYVILSLRTPIASGDVFVARYESALQGPRVSADPRLTTRGFTVLSVQFEPALGYDPGMAVKDEARRQALGLPVDRGDEGAETPESAGRTRALFEATLVVPEGWQGVAPGQLISTSIRHDGRRIQRFRTAGTMGPKFAVAAHPWLESSAELNGLPVRILYAANHWENVERIHETARTSVAAFTALFGGLPNGSLAITEIPAGALAPLSMPGVVFIPENAGFTQDLRMRGFSAPALKRIMVDPTVIVVAHEIAHQWWGLNLFSVKGPGDIWLSESVAQYLALTIVEAMQGRPRLRAALRQQDAEYFSLRRADDVKCGMATCASLAHHVAYTRGSLAWMALEDAVGQTALKSELGVFYRRAVGPVSAGGLLAHLKKSFPTHVGLIESLFEDSVTYRVRVDVSAIEPNAPRTRVSLELRGKGLRGAATGARRVWLEWQADGESLGKSVHLLEPGLHDLDLLRPFGAKDLVVDPDYLLVTEDRGLLSARVNESPAAQ
jgi:hypothetical protein